MILICMGIIADQLCSTIFSKESPYYEYNKAFEKVIKKRELIKIVRQKANERNSKKVMHK